MPANPRRSDIGGEVTSSSVGANVKILWREEELERVHFPLLQVPWSFVGRLRDEAEKNEHLGMMTVDLAILRQDGVPLFNEDFPAMFREVFVRRFVPCLNEKFNQRDPSKPLTKLPEDVSDGLRLLVLCERLKAALKQDVKDHLDRQLLCPTRVVRHAEAAPFKIIQASLELDATVPPRGTLQERVVNHAIELMSNQLPESLDALMELTQMACDLSRGEMCIKLARATAEKALAMAGKAPKGKDKAISRQQIEEPANAEDSVLGGLNDLKIDNTQEIRKMEAERSRLEKMSRDLERERREIREEAARLEHMRATAAQQNAGTPYVSRRGPEMMIEPMDNEMSEENSFNNGQQDHARTAITAQDGILALRQGIVLEKVGKNTGDRIVRLSGDTLEWRRGNGRFTREHQVLRQDVVSIKVVDATGRTFLLSTRTGLLTLRALSEPAGNLFVQALESWVKGQGSKLKRAPMTPSMAVPMSAAPMMSAAAPSMVATNTITSRRFPRISMSFKRPGTKTDNQLVAHRGNDFSFTSNGDGSFLRDD